MSGHKFIVYSCKIEALTTTTTTTTRATASATATATWAFCKVPTATRRGRDSYINTGLPKDQRLSVCNFTVTARQKETGGCAKKERDKWTRSWQFLIAGSYQLKSLVS